MKKSVFVVWLALVFLTVPAISSGGVPVVSELTVTDVTPVSFSVVWIVSEPSNVSVNVFQAPECTTPVAGILINAISIDSTGVSKSTVTGLDPVTSYCYQTVTTSKSTSDMAFSPLTPSLVTTEGEVTRTYSSAGYILPFANDILYFPSYLPDLVTPANGAILLLSIPGSSTPVSAWIADQIATPYALADMNNLFTTSNHSTMNLSGGEVVTIREIRGHSGGTLYHYRSVPEDFDMAEVKPPNPCFVADNDCSERVDIFDAQRCFNQFGMQAGDWDYNDDLDVTLPDENKIDIFDCQTIFNHFGETAPFSGP